MKLVSLTDVIVCRHDKIKSYRFVLVTITLMLIHAVNMEMHFIIKFSVMPAVLHALLTTFDQVCPSLSYAIGTHRSCGNHNRTMSARAGRSFHCMLRQAIQQLLIF